MPYKLDWAPIWDNRELIVEGFLTTIALSALGLVLALIIGVIVGTAGASRARALRAGAAAYVELMRNIPLLVHMYFWYIGLAFLRLPPFACAVAGARALFRRLCGGDRALRASARCRRASAWRRSPPASRRCKPSCSSSIRRRCASSRRRSPASFSQLIKDSSLASVITVAELTYQASAIEGQTFRTFEVYITISLLYLLLVSAVSYGLLLVPGAREDLGPEGERCLRSSSRTCRSCWRGFASPPRSRCWSILGGTLLGLVIGVVRYLRVPVLAQLLALYVGFVRGTPLLVMLFICYFGLPALLGYKTSAYGAAVVGFILFIAAYLAEDIRTGLRSVRRGLVQAALATGLTRAAGAAPRGGADRACATSSRPCSTNMSGCSSSPRWRRSSASTSSPAAPCWSMAASSRRSRSSASWR